MRREELISIRLDLVKRNFHQGKSPTLIAVTKRCPFSDIYAAYKAGVRDFGENRVDELEEKAKAAKDAGLDDLRWHFIGNLQSKKINKLLNIENLHAIHSIDSYELLKNLVQREESLVSNHLKVFLQVNTSNESEKSGLKEWDELAQAVSLLINNRGRKISLHGLMTMSKIRTNEFEKDALKCFKQLSKIRDFLHRDFDLSELKLSMGMSNDYELALQVGTDYIRLGSSLFAPDMNKVD